MRQARPGASGWAMAQTYSTQRRTCLCGKTVREGGRELVGGFSSFVIESMANFPVRLEVFLLREGQI